MGNGGDDTINLVAVDTDWTHFADNTGEIKLYGGADHDSIRGASIASVHFLHVINHIFGEDGADILEGGSGVDHIKGGEAINQILGHGGDDVLWGGTAVDVIEGGDGADLIRGGGGDDWLWGDNASTIASGAFADTIYGDSEVAAETDGNDVIDGEFGDDRIYGGKGNDLMYGGGWTESFGGGDDRIYGMDGEDTILGDTGYWASVSVASGNDELSGGNHDDSIRGGNFTDNISGDAGCDLLFGDGGKDSIYGGANNDFADGGAGEEKGYNFVMDGGSGNDTFLPDYPTDSDLGDPCSEGFGPQMLEGGPVLLRTDTIGFRDQRFTLPFLAALEGPDLYGYLHYFGMTDEQIDMVRRWRRLLLAGDLAVLAAQSTDQSDCSCGDWSA